MAALRRRCRRRHPAESRGLAPERAIGGVGPLRRIGGTRQQHRRRRGGDLIGRAYRRVGRQFEDLRRLARRGLALELQTLRQHRTLSGGDQRGQAAGGTDRRARPIAQQGDQVRNALRQIRGAQVVLVGDALVVERENVGDVGEPFRDHHGKVAGAVGAPDRHAIVGQRHLAIERRQHGAAEIGVAADPVADMRELRQVGG